MLKKPKTQTHHNSLHTQSSSPILQAIPIPIPIPIKTESDAIKNSNINCNNGNNIGREDEYDGIDQNCNYNGNMNMNGNGNGKMMKKFSSCVSLHCINSRSNITHHKQFQLALTPKNVQTKRISITDPISLSLSTSASPTINTNPTINSNFTTTTTTATINSMLKTQTDPNSYMPICQNNYYDNGNDNENENGNGNGSARGRASFGNQEYGNKGSNNGNSNKIKFLKFKPKSNPLPQTMDSNWRCQRCQKYRNVLGKILKEIRVFVQGVKNDIRYMLKQLAAIASIFHSTFPNSQQLNLSKIQQYKIKYPIHLQSPTQTSSFSPILSSSPSPSFSSSPFPSRLHSFPSPSSSLSSSASSSLPIAIPKLKKLTQTEFQTELNQLQKIRLGLAGKIIKNGEKKNGKQNQKQEEQKQNILTESMAIDRDKYNNLKQRQGYGQVL